MKVASRSGVDYLLPTFGGWVWLVFPSRSGEYGYPPAYITLPTLLTHMLTQYCTASHLTALHGMVSER